MIAQKQTALAAQVMDAVSAEAEAMLVFLETLVRAESPSKRPEAQALPQKLLWEAFTALGANVQLVAGKETGGYLVAEWVARDAGVRPRQLLLGHCDTVWPIGTLKEMAFQIDGNLVCGPGVYDMKAGLTQIVFALRVLRQLGLDLAVAPIVLINSDEEIGSPESRDAIQAWARRVERVFVLEPALGVDGKLKTSRKGVGKFELVVSGKAAHAGLDPEKGVSAVVALAHLIQQMAEMNDPARGVTVNVGMISGGLNANVIAPEAWAQIDVRAPTRADAAWVEASLQALQPPLPGTSLTIEGGFGRPPMELTSGNRALWVSAEAVGQTLGFQLDHGRAGGGSDGNLTSPYVATLDGLGAVGEGAHARHERLFLDRWLERTALLALLLLLPPLEDEAER